MKKNEGKLIKKNENDEVDCSRWGGMLFLNQLKMKKKILSEKWRFLSSIHDRLSTYSLFSSRILTR